MIHDLGDALFCESRYYTVGSVKSLFPGNNGDRNERVGAVSLLRKKRIFYILIAITFTIVVYGIRVAWIQYTAAFKALTSGGKTINELAVRQREKGIELDSGRGHFVDRNGELITGFTTWSPILFPIRQLPESKELEGVARALRTTEEQLYTIWRGINTPYVWKQPGMETPYSLPDTEVRQWLKVDGLEILPYLSRYSSRATGNQWLGYVAQRPDVIQQIRTRHVRPHRTPLTLQVGAAGLEKTFDSFLRGIGGVRAYYDVDGQDRPIQGHRVHITAENNRYYPLRVHTTVNMQLQQMIEDLVESMGIKEGAVVVLDASNGDVISMVSRPFYNPYHIDLNGGNWSNRAVKSTIPGSIFKTVIAAAALEEKVSTPSEVFHCTGHYGKYGLSCWKEGGHGRITLQEGYVKSCNTVFAALGERLTAEQIQEAAVKLGFSRKIGWHKDSFAGEQDFRQIDQEEGGTIFGNGVAIDGGVKAQTAIGQRDVRVSPLQAANMIVTLLQGGQFHYPRLVNEVTYKDGSPMMKFPVEQSKNTAEQISPYTAKLLLSWMRQVVTEGTGRTLAQAKWELAGKSGTGQVLQGGQRGLLLNNQWFVGYGPANRPKYAVAVLVQNRPSGSSHQGIELFRGVMELLAVSSGS